MSELEDREKEGAGGTLLCSAWGFPCFEAETKGARGRQWQLGAVTTPNLISGEAAAAADTSCTHSGRTAAPMLGTCAA